MRFSIVRSIAGLLFFLASVPQASSNQDWSRWRGNEGTAHWATGILPSNLSEAQPANLWRLDSGKGYGGVTVANERVYVLDRLIQPLEVERIRCFDATSGKVIWQHEWDVQYGKMGGYSTGPRTSVLLHVVEGTLNAYALGATGQLHCFRAEDGDKQWSVDTVKAYDAKIPQWGFAASPVILKDKLWIHVGAENGTTLALNPATGKETLRGGRDEAGYCTPELVTIHGVEQIIQWGPNHLMALDPGSGRQLWSYPYKITYGVSIAQPLIIEDTLLVSGYWHGTKTLRLNSDMQPSLVWENEKDICGLMSSPLYKDGYVYLLDKTHGLTCFTLAEGNILWRDNNQLTPKDRNPHFSLVWMNRADDLAALLNASGELVYVKITPSGVEEIARHQVIDKTWAHPAFVGNRLFARSDTQVTAWELWPAQ